MNQDPDPTPALFETFETRRDRLFQLVAGAPLSVEPIKPPYEPGRPILPRGYSYSIINFALKAFYLGETQYYEIANQKIQENCRLYITTPVVRDDRDSFYWSSDILCRIIEFFGKHGTIAAGRLDPAAEALIEEMFFLWAKNNSCLSHAETAQSKTWHVWESENHHIQRFSAAWHISKLLQNSARFGHLPYDDGANAREHYRAWSLYAKEWLRERAKKALFVETSNSFYGLHTLKGIYNFFDFTEDREFKRLAQNLLDLYWATWAEEQLNGVRGGGKARVYPGKHSLLGQDPFRKLAWCYLGIGEMELPEENEFTVLTSAYRLPDLVQAIALDDAGRGSYEVIQRPLGLAQAGYFRNPDYRLNTQWGGIIRYSYCTPGFICGCLMCDSRPFEDWTLISSQNRWQGVIFSGHLDARIVLQCRPADYNNPEIQVKRAYNQHWSAQRKGTLITQKLAHSQDTAEMRIWIAGAGLSTPLEVANWCFVESEAAYAAVHVAAGGYQWAEEEKGFNGRWMVCADPWTPVILEVGLKEVFGTYTEFQAAVLAQPIRFEAGELTYESIYGDTFEFYADFSQPARINGKSVLEIPENAFNSPFIQSRWDHGLVTIRKGSQSYRLDFDAHR